jgi:alpha-D-ribose 1-methylphosphonate 5-triphosphate synthase subunit PhnH
MSRELHYDEVFDAQSHYRILLDSMARPGKIGLLEHPDMNPPANLSQASALLAFTLLNSDVTFYVEGSENSELETYLSLNTSARKADVSLADFIFMNGSVQEDLLAEAKTGNLSYPEESATFIVDVQRISETEAPQSLKLTLKGPGVETSKTVYISGMNRSILESMLRQNEEFPLGIDMILSDMEGHILCIPRSNQFNIA